MRAVAEVAASGAAEVAFMAAALRAAGTHAGRIHGGAGRISWRGAIAMRGGVRTLPSDSRSALIAGVRPGRPIAEAAPVMVGAMIDGVWGFVHCAAAVGGARC